MLRVVWYQRRHALQVVAGAVVLIAAGLLAVGWADRADHAFLVSNARTVAFPASVQFAIAVLFGLIGVFLGGPLLSREYEQGTYRFAWTQGTGRLRWYAGQINLLGGLVVLAGAATGALANWALAPFAGPGLASGWFRAEFEAGPATTAGWALFAFMLGVLAGALLKRVTPAMAATAVTLILLLGWYRIFTLRISLLPNHPPWWLPTALGIGLVIVALLAGAVALLLVRNRGARTRGRRPEPE
ncbi:MAG: hypothetical protein JO016_00360 [Actinobacteria bacterium]|nr:hypothetical protein [Actinomycetota bacterium]